MTAEEMKRGAFMILIIVYLALGYWATGKTIYANKIMIDTPTQIFLRRLVFGGLLGWILIPVAIIKAIISR